MSLKTLKWKDCFEKWFCDHENDDSSHDISHMRRVFHLSQAIADQIDDKVDLSVLVAGAYFHDIVAFPKNDPRRSQSSIFAAKRARIILQDLSFPEEKLDSVCHAIEAHSFSANIAAQTVEAKVLQDADRMDAIGALGVARAFYVSGKMGGKPYDKGDPLATKRDLDDKKYGLDHFVVKLLRLKDKMQTSPGKKIAEQRSHFLIKFREKLSDEILDKREGPHSFVSNSFFAAGKEGKQILNQKDPFAKKRVLQKDLYALDNMLQESHSFKWFLDQLQSEIFKVHLHQK